jgi:membrane protein
MRLRFLKPFRIPSGLRDLGRFSKAVWHRFYEDRCSRVAGALSYTTLLALVPLTAVLVVGVSVFPKFKPLIDAVQAFIYTNFVPEAGEVVQKYLQQFARNAGKLTAWGLVFLLVTTLMVIATIEQAFNDIWHAPDRRRRLPKLLAYWALAMLAPILLGLSLSITTFVISLPLFGKQSGLSGVRTLVLGVLPPLIELLAFWFLYRAVPAVRVSWRHALVGSVVAVVLFEVAKRGFEYFVLSFSSYRLIYGALAALPTFFIWIYLSWVIVLLGAVVTAMLPQWGAREFRVPKETNPN